MWFWWFMLIFDLMIPGIQMFAGWMMWKHCPAKINNVYGYRTRRSKKNMDTWTFAHDHCGRLWWKVGLVMLPLTAVAHVPVYGASEDAIGNACLVICVIQMLVLIGSIFPTEWALKRTFNEDGTRRDWNETD